MKECARFDQPNSGLHSFRCTESRAFPSLFISLPLFLSSSLSLCEWRSRFVSFSCPSLPVAETFLLDGIASLIPVRSSDLVLWPSNYLCAIFFFQSDHLFRRLFSVPFLIRFPSTFVPPTLPFSTRTPGKLPFSSCLTPSNSNLRLRSKTVCKLVTS